MRVMRRIGLFAAAGGLLVTASAVGTTVPAGAAESADLTTVKVDGTLLIAQPDGPGARPSYAVELADGDLVPIRGSLADARPLSHLSARLALPAGVLSGLAARGTSAGSYTHLRAHET
jgi:RNase P/RNase MRP subunit p29